MNNYILFQAYGLKSIFDECTFFLLRFAAEATDWEKNNIKIIIYTSDKTMFADCSSALPNIIFEPITMDQVKKWRGDIDFVHRVKIEIISHFFAHYTGNLLYCDTDTYPVKSLQPVFTNINEGKIYMHIEEGNIEPSNQFKKWYRFLTENNQFNFLQKGNAGIAMWNAGVIGLNSRYKNLLPDVLKLTDTIYPMFKKHTVEQFVFSYTLQKNQAINAASSYIYHYWDLKEFRTLLDLWFLNNKGKDIKELAAAAKTISPEKIMIEKDKYANSSFFLKWLKKLKKENWKIDNYFPKD